MERSGWKEGETLGRHRASGSVKKEEATPQRGEHTQVERWIDEDICEVQRTPVVDLTLSEDDEEQSLSTANYPEPVEPSADDETFTALLAPIATTLKSDRLGIGLKAKRSGPYRASKKRITHNAAALIRHERQVEEARRRRERDGRGLKGFQRRHLREETRRKELLAYMNE